MITVTEANIRWAEWRYVARCLECDAAGCDNWSPVTAEHNVRHSSTCSENPVNVSDSKRFAAGDKAVDDAWEGNR